VAILQNFLLLYYTKNPYHLRRYIKIYKLLKDVIIEIAKKGKLYKQRDQLREALEGLLEEILRKRVCKRNANYTRDRDFKKPKK